jgi:hypothetical protein
VAVPTAVASAADWANMTDSERRVGAVHALGTDIATFLFMGSLVARLRGRYAAATRVGPGANLVVWAPDSWAATWRSTGAPHAGTSSPPLSRNAPTTADGSQRSTTSSLVSLGMDPSQSSLADSRRRAGSNGHERRAHGGLALDSHSRRRTEHSCPQRATSGTSGMSGMSGR